MGIKSSLIGVSIWLLLLSSTAEAATMGSFSSVVNSQGDIVLPQDFRKNMVHLGSWFVPDGPASGFHDVYTDASAVNSYRQNGVFPDGAVIVKELRAAHSGNFTTGKGVSYATDEIKQYFVMVKDSKGRFKNNPVWGDGWGWALIKTDDLNRNVAADYKKDCLSCHVPAKDTDWIYSQAYPTLIQP